MTPHLWKLEYNRINRQGNVIPSNGLYLEFVFFYHVLFIDDVTSDCEGCQDMDDHLPKGLKSYSK